MHMHITAHDLWKKLTVDIFDFRQYLPVINPIKSRER